MVLQPNLIAVEIKLSTTEGQGWILKWWCYSSLATSMRPVVLTRFSLLIKPTRRQLNQVLLFLFILIDRIGGEKAEE